DKQDLDSQKVVIERWLAELVKPPKHVYVIRDEGMSGKNENRPGYKELLQLAFNRKIDTIVVYRLDRLSRNATVAIRTILDLDEHGVAFISVTQPVLNLGHSNPFRRTMLAAFAEIAEIERETIVARVRSGLEAAKRRGVVLGPPVKINDEVRQKALDLRLQGWSYRDIGSELGLSVGAIHKALKDAKTDSMADSKLTMSNT
ncbi:MAG: recombinase family protein, partial [Proteobacteria bacterium]|nr:recombinase family protein [Pseudomonadota bacterium]